MPMRRAFFILSFASPGWMWLLTPDFAGSGIEIFIFDLADRTAVYRISNCCTEVFHIETIRAASDLLVRRNPMQISPCGISGWLRKYSAIVMISATPALSSRPEAWFRRLRSDPDLLSRLKTEILKLHDNLFFCI